MEGDVKMKLETPMVSILIASLVFIGFFTIFVTDLADKYNADMNISVFRTSNNQVSLQNAFDRLNETKTEMDEINANFQEEEVTDSGSLFGFLRLTWRIGKQMLGSANIMKEMLYSFSAIIGVPPVFVTTIMTIIIIILIISIAMVLAGRSY